MDSGESAWMKRVQGHGGVARTCVLFKVLFWWQSTVCHLTRQRRKVRISNPACNLQLNDHSRVTELGFISEVVVRLSTLDDLLGRDKVATLLQETLDEEGEADSTLTELAESEINAQASVGASEGNERGG